METLAAAVQRLTFEEKLDCALSLIEKAMTGSLGDSLTPDAVLMHPDGSVQTGIDPFPCDFGDWLSMFADGTDLSGDDVPDEYEDYVIWMQSYGWNEYIDPPLPDGE